MSASERMPIPALACRWEAHAVVPGMNPGGSVDIDKSSQCKFNIFSLYKNIRIFKVSLISACIEWLTPALACRCEAHAVVTVINQKGPLMYVKAFIV